MMLCQSDIYVYIFSDKYSIYSDSECIVQYIPTVGKFVYVVFRSGRTEPIECRYQMSQISVSSLKRIVYIFLLKLLNNPGWPPAYKTRKSWN